VLGVLDAGSARQTIWIERAFRPGEPLSQPAGIRPLPVPPSRVEVREFAGPSFAFVVDSTMPTRFLADFAPLPGRHYELLIEAGGRRLTATAVVPPPVTILAPANDTVDLSADLTVAWRSGGSREFAWLMTPGDTGTLVRDHGFATWVRADTAVVLSAFFYRPLTVVWVMATDSVTASVYDIGRRSEDAERIAGNVQGGVGVFGAMTWDRLYVRTGP